MHLREGRLEDLPHVATITSEALWDDDIVNLLAPHRSKYPLSHRDTYLFRSKKRFFDGNRLIVAVADDQDGKAAEPGDIMGFAFWSDTSNTSASPSKPTSLLGHSFEKTTLKLEGIYRSCLNIDRSFDDFRFAEFRQIVSQHPFFVDITDHWELEILAIAPKYQRRGVGAQLLKWGMKQAASFQLPVVVAATSRGEQLYRKYGFKECDKIDFDEYNFSWTAMVWHPEEGM